MGVIFNPKQFTDGSKPGSDPYDNHRYPLPAPWATRKAKAEGANAVAEFLLDPTAARMADDEALVPALQKLLGWGSVRFQSFDDPYKLATLVRLLQREHPHHDLSRPRLWCDVEDVLKAWLDTSGVGKMVIANGDAFIEKRERTQLRALLAKYPDECS